MKKVHNFSVSLINVHEFWKHPPPVNCHAVGNLILKEERACWFLLHMLWSHVQVTDAPKNTYWRKRAQTCFWVLSRGAIFDACTIYVGALFAGRTPNAWFVASKRVETWSTIYWFSQSETTIWDWNLNVIRHLTILEQLCLLPLFSMRAVPQTLSRFKRLCEVFDF